MACCDDIGQEVKKSEQWTFVGKGKGAYETVSDVVFVGNGKGSINKEHVVEKAGYQWKPACGVALCLILVLLLGIFMIFGFRRDTPGADVPVPVAMAAPQVPKDIIIKHHYITQNMDKVVGYPVPGPAHVVYHKVYAPHKHFDCYTGEMNYRSWTQEHQSWCCWQQGVACPTKVVTKDKYVPVTKTVGVKVPKYSYVPVPGPTAKPLVVHVKVPSAPLPPKIVKDPYPVQGARPPAHIHYKYVPVTHHVKVPKVVYDRKVVPVPVSVPKYVPRTVQEPPKVIYKTHTVYDHPREYDCVTGFHDYHHLWGSLHREYCCWKVGRACPTDHEEDHTHTVTKIKYIDVPVPSPPKVVIRHHKKIIMTHQHAQRHFDCHAGFSNWFHGWSRAKKGWCCAHESRGCPGTWHGSMHVHTTVTVHTEGGHATGKIYDCDAGYSNWLQGWSDSKKSWCCHHDPDHRGCVDYHCFHGHPDDWSSHKSAWCCKTFQRGCPATTLSHLGCQAPCTYKDKTSLCIDRITWAMDHQYQGRGNACALAYSQVQVECDICRACSIQEAGCEVHVATSEPYDCDAALNNFFRAWSPPKKHWCCSVKGKGCEGAHPPAVDPGFGMVWKHVQVSGYWTWIAVSGGGGAMSLPYDCHVGLANWHVGWSAPKKVWCCAHQHMGCEGGSGGGGGGGYTQTHTIVTTHVVHSAGGGGAGAGGGGIPPGAAGHGMMWQWSNDGGHWHWVQVHLTGDAKYDCHAGLANWKLGWSDGKKNWCCHFRGLGCA